MLGSFSEEALRAYSELAAQARSADFAEGGTYDFTRCVRPDGSAYGTGGRCRKGTEEKARPKDNLAKKTLKETGKILASTPGHTLDMIREVSNTKSKGKLTKEALKEAKTILASVPGHIRDLIRETPSAVSWLFGKD